MTRPLQIYLNDTDFARLEEWAREHGWTKSHAVRVALRALTRPREADPLLGASGMIEGLPEDLSEQFERYLEDTYVAEAKPRYTGKRRSP
jgi:hypothetical protein